MKKLIFFGMLLLVPVVLLKAQVPDTSQLFQTLKKHDSIFFERGFNQCDLEFLDKAIHKDLRFYHDQSGVQDKHTFFENTKKSICAATLKKPIRKVDEKSLEVFPLYKNGVLYGAIQNGIHHFYQREPGKEDVHSGNAKFTHLYVLENGQWLLLEVLSFDHK